MSSQLDDPLRSWPEVGIAFNQTQSQRDRLAAEIERLAWQKLPARLPMMAAAAFRSVITEFRLPATHVSSSIDLGNATLFGIEVRYPQGRMRVYFADTGVLCIPVVHDFWPPSEQLARSMSAADEPVETTCDNCGVRFDDQLETQLTPLRKVRGLAERLDPGSIVPVGECPECGALVYVRGQAVIAAAIAALVRSESDALAILETFMQRYGWSGGSFTRANADKVLGRSLTDDEWARVHQCKSWRALADMPDEHIEMMTTFALHEAGVLSDDER